VYRPFEFQKRSKDIVGADDETLSVAMRVSNPDCSPARIQSRDAAPTPSGFAEIVALFEGTKRRCTCEFYIETIASVPLTLFGCDRTSP
jgi:hypothetical protein